MNSYNLLSELDQEGEYYINRTSGMLYVWPPANSSSAYWQSAPWGAPVVAPQWGPRGPQLAGSGLGDAAVGALSINGTVLNLTNAAFLTFSGVVITSGRNVGVAAVNTTSVHIVNSVVENFGNMAVNVRHEALSRSPRLSLARPTPHAYSLVQVTGGSDFRIDNCEVRHAGNGAIFFYGGNRTTLEASNHTVFNSSVSYS